ncbi:hypothetical protein MJO28_009916, partial [Puccinia striiformis f. sp. tritici]
MQTLARGNAPVCTWELVDTTGKGEVAYRKPRGKRLHCQREQFSKKRLTLETSMLELWSYVDRITQNVKNGRRYAAGALCPFLYGPAGMPLSHC